MTERPEDLCPAPSDYRVAGPRPHSAPIYLASVYACTDPDEAEQLLAGKRPGYIYQRDRHPNGDWLGDKLRRLHGADWALLASSGMAALTAALLGRLQTGDRVAYSDRLYGRTTQLLAQRLPPLGIETDRFDVTDAGSLQTVLSERTRLVIVETISNPMLRVADLEKLAGVMGDYPDCRLLVDNTFATPWTCLPLRWGADLVLESVSKMLNGHSDCMLGLLCGGAGAAVDDRTTMSVWGLSAGPMECWLAERGLATFALRMERSGSNALRVARWLQDQSEGIAEVVYPGLEEHSDHTLATRLFVSGRGYGNMVSFTVGRDGDSVDRKGVSRFIHASGIPFCPSLGEVGTTLSHPASTSHRLASPSERRRLGICEGTIRLSVGSESVDTICAALARGLAAI